MELKKSTLLFNVDEDKGTRSVQQRVVTPYRCSGTTYRSRFQGPRMPVTFRYTVYIGKGVGGDLFSLSVMPANTFDAVLGSQEGGQKVQCYSGVNDMGK